MPQTTHKPPTTCHPQTSINNPLNPSGVGLVNFFGESQSRLYPHMRAKFGCGPTVVSKKGSLKFISRYIYILYIYIYKCSWLIALSALSLWTIFYLFAVYAIWQHRYSIRHPPPLPECSTPTGYWLWPHIGAKSKGISFLGISLHFKSSTFRKISESSRKPSNCSVRNQCLDNDSWGWCGHRSPNK